MHELTSIRGTKNRVRVPGTVVETLSANGIAVGSSDFAVSNGDVLASFDR